MVELRLKEVSIENFRSISGRCVVPLDGEIILVHGANGAGKTSLLSAIELAATGRVGYLDEQSADPGALLRNHDYPLGQVRLSLSHEGLDRTAVFDLGDRIVGKPILSDAEQVEFRERTFLPQTALARLLETYTDSGKGVDSALVRFVKSLVGLDDLDALIDGLQAAGHVSRSKKLVPSWARALDELDSLEQQLNDSEARIRTAQSGLDELAGEVRRMLGVPDDVENEEIFRRLYSPDPRNEPGEEELVALEGLKAVVDAVSGMRKELGAQWSISQIEDEALRAKESVDAYERWVATEGRSLIAELNRIREDFLGLSQIDLPQLIDGYRETQERLSAMNRENTGALAADRERAETIGALESRIIELDSAVSDLELQSQSINVPADARVFIEILGALLPRVDSDVCPVCDQDFRSEGTLAEHINEKVTRLSEGAQGLVRIESTAASLKEERTKFVRKAELLKSVATAAQSEAFDPLIRIVNGMEGSVTRGSRLQREVEVAQRREANARSAHSQYRVITQRIEEVADALDHPQASLPQSEPELTLGQIVDQRIQRHRYRDTQRRWEREVLESVQDANRRLEVLHSDREDLRQRRDRVKKQVSSAQTRMTQTRGLLLQAEQTRSLLINEVFDQSLNSLWAQLFSRFAPTERFTPRFVKQTRATRAVDVRLETQLPDGTVSGAPGAMLSYGNTNSAALALFMAVHLSAPAKLPWLIFDDPVQSMDDIHIANFAAIVRQLAFMHGRQVIIAIHQPELFEYLSLELAPSRPKQTLIKVQLERGDGVTRVSVDRVNHHHEQQLA